MTNEERAHDLAMFRLKFEFDTYLKLHDSKDKPRGEYTFDMIDEYLKGYKIALEQLNKHNI